MATFEELMQQARAAYAAGDIDAAKALGAQAKAARGTKPGFSPAPAIAPDLPTPSIPQDVPGPSGFTEQIAALMGPPIQQTATGPRVASPALPPQVPAWIEQAIANPPPAAPQPAPQQVPPAAPMDMIATAMGLQPARPAPQAGAPAWITDALANPPPANQTPLGEALLTEIGNAPERVERGFRGNFLAGAERGIITALEAAGRGKSILGDLEAVQQQRRDLEQAYLAAPADQRIPIQQTMQRLRQEEERLSRAASTSGFGQAVVDQARTDLERNQRTRADQQARIDQLDAAIIPTNPAPGLDQALVSGIASLADMAPGMATTLATKNPIPMLAYLGLYSRGGAYADKRAEGYDSGKSLTAANLYAVAEAVPEIVPLHVILKDGIGAASKIAGGAITEGASEVLTQALQQMIDMGVLDESMTWGQAIEEMKQAGAAGAVMGGLMGGGGALADTARSAAQRRREAKGTPADPNAAPLTKATPGPRPAPPAAPMDQIASAMQPPAPDQAPMAPQPAQPGPQQPDPMAQITAAMTGQPAPKSGQNGQAITRAEAEANPDRYEIVDESEGQGANWRPTGAQVVIDKTTGQAIPLAPDTAAANPAANAAIEIAPDGFKLVHGGKSGLTLDAIEIIRTGQKQAKNGKKLGGFYAASEADADYAESYAGMVDGGTTYDVVIKPGTKILRKDGDITRLSEKQIADWLSQGIGIVVGKDPRGKTEYAVIDKNAIQSLDLRRLPSPPSSSGAIQTNDQGNQATGPAPEADVVAAAGGTTPPAPVPNQPRNFEFVDAAGVQNIQTEPEVMQYKAGGDAEGVTDRLRGVTEWRPERAGMSIIYEYADGRRVIADGHQRLGLAKRLAGQGKQIQMPAMILRQADGVTPEGARVIAALKNIAEGSGTALDAAKVLRGSSETVEQMGLPPNSAIVRDALGMRALSDTAFGMVANGVASERDGGIVGRVVTDKDAQANILGLLARLQKDRPMTAFQAESVARQAAADTVTQTQDSLFGPEADTQNLYLERAKILEAASRMTRDEARAFKNVLTNADRLAAAGNQLDAEGNQTRLDSAAAMRDYLTREANTKGAISEALTAAARALNGGATLAGATRQFLDAVEQRLAAGGLVASQRPDGSSDRPGGDQGGQTAGSNRPQESGDQGLNPDTRDENAADGDLFGGPVAAPAPDPMSQIAAAMTGQAPERPTDDMFGATPQTGKTQEQIRAEAEAKVRADQSKMRKPGGNAGDAGPLFDGQGDLLGSQGDKDSGRKEELSPDAEKPAAPTATRQPQNGSELIQRGRAILQRYSGDSDALYNQNAGRDLRATSQGLKLADDLLAAKTMAAKKKLADDFVLAQGRATGDEHLVVLDGDGVPLAIMRGGMDWVSAHAEVWRAAHAGVVGYATHNHPQSTSFSGPDVSMIFAGFSPLSVVGHDGTVQTAEAAPGVLANWEGKTKDGVPQVRDLGEAFSQVRNAMTNRTNFLILDMKDIPRDEQPSYWTKVNKALFLPLLDRMGVISYSDQQAVEKVEALGINFEDIYGQVSGNGFDRLRRAGLVIPEGAGAGGNRPAASGTGTAPSATDSADQGTANDAGKRAGSVAPAKTGNADLDGALDDLFGDETDVSGTGTDLERPGRDRPSSDDMGAGNVPPAAGGTDRGASGGRKAADGADGQRGADGGLPDRNAPSVGGGSNPGADGSGGADSKPAASGKRGRRNGGGNGRLPADGAAKGNAAGNASGATGKLTPAQQLAAIRNALKEDAVDFVAGPRGYSFREDTANPIDPRKKDAIFAIIASGESLAGVNVKATTDRDLFRAIVMPLKDAGMTRAEVTQLTPYLEAFLADLRAGRVNLNPEAELIAPSRDIEADNRSEMQAEADKVKVKMADRANIDATLPLLLPEQREDVFKIETRFAKPDGHGMLITNGTGTGKTFTGGGVIKRFVQQGKSNVLIVAPSDAVIDGWVNAMDTLGVSVSRLENTKDAGQGVVVTTYANMRENNALATRDWDLVVTDEAQNLMSNATGDPTSQLKIFRAITHRPADLFQKSRMLHADDWAAYKQIPKGQAKDAKYRSLKEREEREVQAWRAKPRPKALFLSATPFSYDKTVDYAEGYLFSYPDDGKVGNSNQSGRNLFMVQNFGYRIRYHKLTKPEHAVDSAVFEREFHENMKRQGVLSGRSLQVDVDYDRKFVKKEDADGTRLDEALELLDKLAQDERAANYAKVKAGDLSKKAEPFSALQNHMRKNFDYLARQQLLEAIKARLAVDEIKAHLALGRKVVVFHDFNVGGGLNPFTHLKTKKVGVDEATGEEIREVVSPMTSEAWEGYRKLLEAHPWIEDLNFAGYKPPVEALPAALGKTVRVFNGDVPPKQRLANLAAFNTDGSGVDVLVVQADAGGAGISMHDVTGKQQRALINLGMPTKPTTTLQQEGRIRRVGSKTDAIFRYFTIGTVWERIAFAQRIAERSGTVENLALGNDARDLTNAFIDAYMDAADFAPSAEDGKGGAAKDKRGHNITPFQRAVSHYFGRPKISARRDQRDGIDFYPTAEPLAYKMVEWAGIRANERVLEPSAGDGAIVRYMPDDVALHFVEPSTDLHSTAQLRAPKGIGHETTFENHHISNKYHVIVMNPPFGSGGSTAMQHLAKAAKHLRAGGRIVALIPTGPSADKKFATWWESDDAKGLNLSAEVQLPAVAFERAGTGVMTRVVIIDKPADGQVIPMGQQNLNFTGAQNINDFFDRLEGYEVRRRPDPVQDVIEELEAEGQDATTPANTRRPGPPLATEIGSFEKTTVTSKKGKVFPAAHHAAKVERDVYDQMKAAATALDGWWHRNDAAPKGSGPTFAFRTEAARDAFLADMQKPTAPGGFEETYRLYHGTNNQDEIRRTNTLKSPVFLTPSKSTASDYAGDDGEVFSFDVEESDLLVDLDLPGAALLTPEEASGYLSEYDQLTIGDFISRGYSVASINNLQLKEQRAQMVREAAATTEEIRRLMPKLRAELDRLDLKRVRLSSREGDPGWQGAFVVTGDGEMEIVIGASLDPVKTLHHEVIHALRAMNLFTPEEWKALTLAAERKWLAKHDIAARYPHLTEAERIEEAIAEEFSEALAAKQAPKGSILIQAFNKIARVFRAFRNVLNGAGYQTPEDIFGRVLAGEVSARQAGNTGAQISFQRKGRDTETNDLFAQPEPARPSGMTADQRRELEARQRQSKMRKVGGNSGDAGPLFNDDRDLFGDRIMFQRPPLAVRPLTPQARAHRNSAMGATPFIPDRRVWETLTRAGIPVWQRLRDLPGAASDAVDRARYTIQDRMLPFLRAQEAVMKQTGRPLPKEHDVYLQETTFSGKVGRHLLEIDEEYTKPIIQIIAASKGKMDADSVGEWLYARHAVERNAYIASINPNMPDGGSGMLDADAQMILANIAASPEAAQYDRIGALIDAMRERNLKLREDAGLISQADAQVWRAQYKHYVPLKGFEETDHYESMMDLRGVRTGRRFSQRGPESRRALGRNSEAFNPLQSAITQAQEVAIRAEKNRVAQAMFELAANHPSAALWEVKRPKQKRYFNRTTGLVEMRVENPVTMVLEPNEMAVKIDGKEHRILFNDQRLAESAGTLGADQMGAALRVLSMFSRFFSMTRTMLNPEFMVTNAFRDFQTAQFNIQAFGEGDKARIAKAMAKNWRKAFMGAMRGSTYRFDTEWSRYYREFQKAGAQVSFWTMEQPEAARDDLNKRIKLARGTKAQRALKVVTTPSAFFSFRDNAALNFIERSNMAVDNAIRLAAFVEARRAGWDVEKAAFLAKELTVNFNRRGEAGPQMNALFPFFNAAVQGSVRTAKALRSRRVALMVLTAFAAGTLLDLINAALSKEDEDGELFYDKVANFRNERNLHFGFWGTGASPVAIPMPYGYNVFPYAGQQLGKVMRGVKAPDEAFADVVLAAFGGFSPITAATPAQLVSPVFSDPIVELAENKNWLGNPIYPRDYGNQTQPDAYVHFRTATEVSKWVAQSLNDLTGGDFREAGAIDVSPETLDHLAAFAVGSAGAFWGRTGDVIGKALRGDFDSIESRSVPFLRSITSPIGDWADRDRYYRFKGEVENAQADKKAYVAAGVPVPKRTADLAALYDDLLKAGRELSGKGEWNPSKPNATVARDQAKVWLDFNGKYLAVMGKQGE